MSAAELALDNAQINHPLSPQKNQRSRASGIYLAGSNELPIQWSGVTAPNHSRTRIEEHFDISGSKPPHRSLRCLPRTSMQRDQAAFPVMTVVGAATRRPTTSQLVRDMRSLNGCALWSTSVFYWPDS